MKSFGNGSYDNLSFKAVTNNFRKTMCNKLRRETGDEVLLRAYDLAIEAACRYCEKSFSGEFAQFAGQFTSHGPDHASRVLRLAMRLGAFVSPALTARELFTLGIAAILHDIGMTAPLPKSVTDSDVDEDYRWQQRRIRHGEATAELIRSCVSADLKLVAAADRDVYDQFLPDICAAHCTKDFIRYCREIKEYQRQRNEVNRYAILAGLLLIADELDITYLRAQPDRARYHEFKTVLTKAHWWKCWLVAGLKIDRSIIQIMYLAAKDGRFRGSEEFSSWTIAKLHSQLSMLQQELDPDGSNALWRFDVSLHEAGQRWWSGELPDLTADVLEAAQQARLGIPGQKLGRVYDPARLIDAVASPHESRMPSEFFQQAISKRIYHFRGQGQYVSPARARRLYVEQPENMQALNNAIDDWRRFMIKHTSGVNIKIFTGEIGVGKTHFLGAFLHEIERQFPDLFQKSILIRAELTERERRSLLDVQRCVALKLYDTLYNENPINKMQLGKLIREIMITGYRPGVEPPIPKYREEIHSWQEQHVNEMIRVVGDICKPESGIHVELGSQAPIALCMFIDNSDHLDSAVVAELYSWANNMSGTSGALLWIFLRPETYSYLQERYQCAPFSLRDQIPIQAPSLKDVVNKRIETFREEFGNDDRIVIPYGHLVYSPSDVQEGVFYVTSLALETAGHMLPKLTDRPDDKKSPNLRAGLQGLLGILGSHILSDGEFARAIMLHKTGTYDGALKTAVEQWPRVLEAMILSRRVWYSARHGAVENLFDPPELEEHGDYFLLIHCLQSLLKKSAIRTFGDLCERLSRMGYSHFRLNQAIRFLAERTQVLDEGNPLDDPFPHRTFPLVLIKGKNVKGPMRDDTILRITPWGEYHIRTLVEQAQYWKHISYQVIMPNSLLITMQPEVIHGDKHKLSMQLRIMFNFLQRIETGWLYRCSHDSQKELNIWPIMKHVEHKVLQQLE